MFTSFKDFLAPLLAITLPILGGFIKLIQYILRIEKDSMKKLIEVKAKEFEAKLDKQALEQTKERAKLATYLKTYLKDELRKEARDIEDKVVSRVITHTNNNLGKKLDKFNNNINKVLRNKKLSDSIID